MKVYIVYQKEDISDYEPTIWVYIGEKKAKKHLQELIDDYGVNSYALIEEEVIV